MPLSKCRFCGKMIPNPYHKRHEQFTCVQMRIQRGDYVEPKAKRKAEKEKEALREKLRESIRCSPLLSYGTVETKPISEVSR
jgi:N-formylglutamate amidohydrolase